VSGHPSGASAGDIRTAWDLVGWDHGLIRVVGGRVNWEAVLYNCASGASNVRLARLEAAPGGRIRERYRYVDPDTKIEIISVS
jgi:hypothetical protein